LGQPAPRAPVVYPIGQRGASWLRAVLVALALAAVMALVAWPWLRADTQWLDTGDGPNHLRRIYVIDDALRRGDWFPRWLPDLYLGYGYPLLSYYAPASYYVAAAFGALGLSVYHSLVWTGTLGVGLGATGAFTLARALYGGRGGAALLASVAYVLAPYPFYANLYGRAAVPEVLALGLLPWLLRAALGTWRHGSHREGWAAALALITGALLLTHNISSVLGFSLLAAWTAALPWIDSEHAPADPGGVACAWGRVAAAVAAGAALAAFFWVPALAETRYVHIERARGGVYDFHSWLFTWPDLWLGLQRGLEPAAGGLQAGPRALLAQAAVGKSIPERVSPWQSALWLLALLLPLLTRRRPKAAVFWCASATACWLLNASPAAWLWEHLPLLVFVQFPWRLYGPLSLGVALAGAAALAALDMSVRQERAAAALLVAVAAVLAAGSNLSKPYHPGSPPAHDVDGQDLIADETNHFGAGTTGTGEFLPRTVWFAVYTKGIERGIKLYDDARDEAGWQAGLVRLLGGRAAVVSIDRAPNWIGATVEAETPAQLAFHQLLFPGWRAFVDGRPAAVAPAPYDERLQASLGYMVVQVPAGMHRVEVRFGPTTVRLAASLVSAGAAASLLAWWALTVTRVRRPQLRAAGAMVAAGAGLAAAAIVQLQAMAPQAAAPAGTARVIADIAGTVRSGHAATAAPNGSGAGVLPPFLDVQFEEVAREQRRWLYMHPPSRVSIRLRVPPQAYLQAGLALDPATWTADVGDGVRFLVEADSPGGHVLLLDRQLNPRARLDERGWNDVWVSLAPVAGQEVTLTLRTEPGHDLSFDWAGWANPQVVIWDAARPNPGAPHPY